jgi:lactate dehydrogenase-like 2-hydroxyacid dehydrogenase
MRRAFDRFFFRRRRGKDSATERDEVATIRRPRVLVGVQLHEEAMARLRDAADVTEVEEAVLQEKVELLRIIGEYDGAIIALPPFDRDVIARAARLKVISRRGVGYDTVDLRAAAARGIRVTITPALSETVADLAFALILATARAIPQAHAFVTAGRWQRRSDRDVFIGSDVSGKTLGIIGLGRIGSCVARRGVGFSMETIYYDVQRNHDAERRLGVTYRPLGHLLSEADIVTLHVPLSAETRGLLGPEELRQMKPTAILVNTSRGPVVDANALRRALREKWIAAAGLDVFEDEPVRPDDSLLTCENVVLTPHIASATRDCRRRCALLAVENALRVLRGVEPRYAVA